VTDENTTMVERTILVSGEPINAQTVPLLKEGDTLRLMRDGSIYSFSGRTKLSEQGAKLEVRPIGCENWVFVSYLAFEFNFRPALEACHHAELVEELSRARAYLCVSEAATDSTMRPLYTKDELVQRIRAITTLLAKLGTTTFNTTPADGSTVKLVGDDYCGWVDTGDDANPEASK
jgi:hypothetical protein